MIKQKTTDNGGYPMRFLNKSHYCGEDVGAASGGGTGSNDGVITQLVLNGTDLSAVTTNGAIAPVDLSNLPSGGSDDQVFKFDPTSGDWKLEDGGSGNFGDGVIFSNDILTIFGVPIDLSVYLDDTDDQKLRLNGTVVEISEGNSIDLAPILGNNGDGNGLFSASNNAGIFATILQFFGADTTWNGGGFSWSLPNFFRFDIAVSEAFTVASSKLLQLTGLETIDLKGESAIFGTTSPSGSTQIITPVSVSGNTNEGQPLARVAGQSSSVEYLPMRLPITAPPTGGAVQMLEFDATTGLPVFADKVQGGTVATIQTQTFGGIVANWKGDTNTVFSLTGGRITATVASGGIFPENITLEIPSSVMVFTSAFFPQNGISVSVDNSANSTDTVGRSISVFKKLTNAAVSLTANPAQPLNPLDSKTNIVSISGGIFRFICNDLQAIAPNGAVILL